MRATSNAAQTGCMAMAGRMQRGFCHWLLGRDGVEIELLGRA